MPRSAPVKTILSANAALVIEAACPKQGLDNFQSAMHHIFAITDNFVASQSDETVDKIVKFHVDAKYKPRSSNVQKWAKWESAGVSDAITRSFEQHTRTSQGSKDAFIMPSGKFENEKVATLYLWLPTLLKDMRDGLYQRRRDECLTKAPLKWDQQKKAMQGFLTKLGFDSWTEAAQKDLLQQVSNVKLSRFDVARGARRAQSILMLPLFERAGLQLLFTNLRKENVWIKKERKRKRVADDASPRAAPAKKAKTASKTTTTTTTTIATELDESIVESILDEIEMRVEMPTTPTQSPRHSPMSPAETQGQMLQGEQFVSLAPLNSVFGTEYSPVCEKIRQDTFSFDTEASVLPLSTDDLFIDYSEELDVDISYFLF